MTHTSQSITLLRLPEVKARIGLSRSALYKQIQDGLFTRPIKLGPRAVAWPSREIEAIAGLRIAGKSDAEIRQEVAKLAAARQKVA